MQKKQAGCCCDYFLLVGGLEASDRKVAGAGELKGVLDDIENDRD